MLSLLNEHESTTNLPIGVKTMAASASAGAFRIFLMPIDAAKTIMQAGILVVVVLDFWEEAQPFLLPRLRRNNSWCPPTL
jgi:hypothetical protein